MAGEIASAFVRIRPNTAGFRADTERGVKGAFAGIGKLAATAGLAFGGFEFFKAAIKDAAEEERALGALQTSVDSVGASWRVHGRSLKDVLVEMSLASGASIPDLSQGFLRLVTATKDSEVALKDLHRAEDIATARHMKLAQASVILARAEGGSDTALRRLGIIIPKLHPAYDALTLRIKEAAAQGAKFTAADKLILKQHLDQAKAMDARASKERVLTEIDARFGGQTARFAQTAQGQYDRFHQSVRRVLVDVGTALLPSLTRGAEGLRIWIQGVRHGSQYSDTLRGSVHSLGQIIHGVGAIAKVAGPPLETMAKGAAGIVGALGGSTIVAAVLAYKGLGVALSIAARAEGALTKGAVTATAAQDAQTASAGRLTVAETEAGAAAKTTTTRLTLLGSPPVLAAIAATTAALWLLHKAQKASDNAAAANDRVASARQNALTFYARQVAAGMAEGLSRTEAQMRAVEKLIEAHRRDASIAGPDAAGPRAKAIHKQIEDDMTAGRKGAQGIAAGVKGMLGWVARVTKPAAKDAGKKVGADLADGIGTGVTDAEARAIYKRAIASVSGSGLGLPLVQGLIDQIRAGSPGLSDQLATSVTDAITAARLSIHDAFESAASNLNQLGGSVGGRIGDELDRRLTIRIRRIENTIDLRIRNMRDRLDAVQAVRERRSLREDVTAAAVGAAGLRREPGESATDFQAQRLEAAKRITDANIALKDFETEQTISTLQRRSDRTKEHLQKQNELAKESAQRSIADLTDAFNRGAITQEQLVAGIATQMKRQHVTYREAGKLLGSAFAHGFSAEVAALGKQAGIISKLPHLPGVTGVEPTLVRPIDAVRTAILSVAQAQASRDQSLLEEARRQTAEQKKIAKAQAAAAGKQKAKNFVDDLTTGSKR